jgi:hypothetical protein
MVNIVKFPYTGLLEFKMSKIFRGDRPPILLLVIYSCLRFTCVGVMALPFFTVLDETNMVFYIIVCMVLISIAIEGHFMHSSFSYVVKLVDMGNRRSVPFSEDEISLRRE